MTAARNGRKLQYPAAVPLAGRQDHFKRLAMRVLALMPVVMFVLISNAGGRRYRCHRPRGTKRGRLLSDHRLANPAHPSCRERSVIVWIAH